ncbi:MAG: hypothetical protein EXR86_06770 [Gammaproteobacteria bacterium]|nr:hypothetical protein [Gammaproteobacteria bacterium]
MASILPTFVDSARLAASRARLQGHMPATQFIRITSAFSLVGAVNVTLEFALNDRGQPVICGELHLRATAQCQRCLETAHFELNSVLAHEVEDEYRTKSDTGNTLFDLAAFIEDECILTFPISAMHPAGACIPPGDPALIAGGGPNPFDVLTSLRQNER